MKILCSHLDTDVAKQEAQIDGALSVLQKLEDKNRPTDEEHVNKDGVDGRPQPPPAEECGEGSPRVRDGQEAKKTPPADDLATCYGDVVKMKRPKIGGVVPGVKKLLRTR